jgi:hypothetical protein
LRRRRFGDDDVAGLLEEEPNEVALESALISDDGGWPRGLSSSHDLFIGLMGGQLV